MIEHQNQIWYGYYLSHELNKAWYWQGEVHERHFVDPFLHHQFALRAHIHHVVNNNLEFSTGAAIFFNTPSNSNNKNRLSIPEYRPHVDAVYKNIFNLFQIEHRLRIEARFYQSTDTQKTRLEDEIQFGNFRYRYRFQIGFPIWKKIRSRINTEILLNVGQLNPKNILDQHRIFAGINVPLKPNLNVEIGYLHSFQQLSNLNYFDRSILSIMLYHKL
jgi:hypothetical protein